MKILFLVSIVLFGCDLAEEPWLNLHTVFQVPERTQITVNPFISSTDAYIQLSWLFEPETDNFLIERKEHPASSPWQRIYEGREFDYLDQTTINNSFYRYRLSQFKEGLLYHQVTTDYHPATNLRLDSLEPNDHITEATSWIGPGPYLGNLFFVQNNGGFRYLDIDTFVMKIDPGFRHAYFVDLIPSSPPSCFIQRSSANPNYSSVSSGSAIELVNNTTEEGSYFIELTLDPGKCVTDVTIETSFREEYTLLLRDIRPVE